MDAETENYINERLNNCEFAIGEIREKLAALRERLEDLQCNCGEYEDAW